MFVHNSRLAWGPFPERRPPSSQRRWSMCRVNGLVKYPDSEAATRVVVQRSIDYSTLTKLTVHQGTGKTSTMTTALPTNPITKTKLVKIETLSKEVLQYSFSWGRDEYQRVTNKGGQARESSKQP